MEVGDITLDLVGSSSLEWLPEDYEHSWTLKGRVVREGSQSYKGTIEDTAYSHREESGVDRPVLGRIVGTRPCHRDLVSPSKPDLSGSTGLSLLV